MLNTDRQKVLVSRYMSSPSTRQLRPATIPYVGLVIESTVEDRLLIALVKVGDMVPVSALAKELTFVAAVLARLETGLMAVAFAW
ncbi:unnamed protein product [Sphagnum balticum]